MNRLLIGLLALVFSFSSFAVEVYEFESAEQEKRYQRFSTELRCPKCQNQAIGDSDAPIAKDLRREVHRMITEGSSAREIVEFMTERYGDFVLYRPPLRGDTILLWSFPLIALIVGMIFAVRYVRQLPQMEKEGDVEGMEDDG